jgi:hypothetical protein
MAILIKRKDLEARIRAIASRDNLSIVDVIDRAFAAVNNEAGRHTRVIDVAAIWRSVGVEPPPPGPQSVTADYDALYGDPASDAK